MSWIKKWKFNFYFLEFIFSDEKKFNLDRSDSFIYY